MQKNGIIFMATFFLALSCSRTPEPMHCGPLPSLRQLAWHEMEFYAFVHFGTNTFTDLEWGFGDADPNIFNPTELDCDQWAFVAKEAGMKGIILTAKHHDGFCLWPSSYTEYSVKNSSWKDGKGDVVLELSKACKKYGLKMGLYLSPWDRNHPEYGKSEYITYYRNQLRELLTNYGEISEVWFDGANGGSGYYGGANETRYIDRRTYYDWENTWKIVRELQPNVVMFSDCGPDVRWVGNENGWANPTNWCLLRRDEFWPGVSDQEQLQSGQEDGCHWVPAEVNVSIRPGWFYHPAQDNQVKSLAHLVTIYYNSVGRNGSLLLNLPVDRRGLIHENDVRRLKQLGETMRADFSHELARGKPATASNVRGKNRKYSAAKAVDDKKETYWAMDDGVTSGYLTIDLGKPTEFNRVLIQEYITLGQRVKSFSVEAHVGDDWKIIARETTIGYKRILRLPSITADKVRLNIKEAKACPLISNFALYNAPVLVTDPSINRNK